MFKNWTGIYKEVISWLNATRAGKLGKFGYLKMANFITQGHAGTWQSLVRNPTFKL
jgi:hypothetical protein